MPHVERDPRPTSLATHHFRTCLFGKSFTRRCLVRMIAKTASGSWSVLNILAKTKSSALDPARNPVMQNMSMRPRGTVRPPARHKWKMTPRPWRDGTSGGGALAADVPLRRTALGLNELTSQLDCENHFAVSISRSLLVTLLADGGS